MRLHIFCGHRPSLSEGGWGPLPGVGDAVSNGRVDEGALWQTGIGNVGRVEAEQLLVVLESFLCRSGHIVAEESVLVSLVRVNLGLNELPTRVKVGVLGQIGSSRSAIKQVPLQQSSVDDSSILLLGKFEFEVSDYPVVGNCWAHGDNGRLVLTGGEEYGLPLHFGSI